MPIFPVTRRGATGQYLVDPAYLTGARQDARGKVYVDPALSAGAVRVDDQGRYFVIMPLNVSLQPVDVASALTLSARPFAPLSFALAVGHAIARSGVPRRSAVVGAALPLSRGLSASRSSALTQAPAVSTARTLGRRVSLEQAHSIGRLVSGFSTRSFALVSDHTLSIARTSVFTRFLGVPAGTVLSSKRSSTRSALLAAGPQVLVRRSARVLRFLANGHAFSFVGKPARTALVQAGTEASRRAHAVRSAAVPTASVILRPAVGIAYWLIGRRGK